MKFRLDENFGTRTQRIFRESGHDVLTVREESLQGTTDMHLYQVCSAEQCCLVTLDLDFANVIRFPPEKTGGIAVIRVPRNPSSGLLERLVRQFLQACIRESVEKGLWIVEVNRIRVHHNS